jgi:hypothetical protein
MAGTDSIVGSGSLMPESFYLKKMETTCIYEDPDQLEKFYRQSLKDVSPDKPFFESDQPRYNNYSQDRLNLRHYGKRVETLPYLPDGTFLDHVFLDKDPRGIALEPDMMKHRKQQEARGQFIKHGYDDDFSVPSTGWNPTKVVTDIKNQLYNVKDRLKIFEESKDNRHNGTRMAKLSNKARCAQEFDERARDMRDEVCATRNYVSDLSNSTKLGWARTTDHRFKVAKYGQVRKSASASDQNWNKNRANARVEHDVLVSWKDQTVPKSVMLKMIDLAKRKYNDIESGKHVILGESEKTQVRSKRLSPKDLKEITAVDNAQIFYDPDGEMKSRGKVNPYKHENNPTKSVIDPFIMEFISNINRKMTKREMDDLRDQILQSSEYNGILLEQKNKECNAKLQLNNELLWNSVANYEKGKSIKIANYKRIAKNTTLRSSKNCDSEFDQRTEEQKLNEQRKRRELNDLYKMDYLDYDNKYGEEKTGTKLGGILGSKYTRGYIDRDNEEMLPEVIARN